MRGVHGGGASIVVVGSGKSGTAARRGRGAPGRSCWEGLLGGGLLGGAPGRGPGRGAGCSSSAASLGAASLGAECGLGGGLSARRCLKSEPFTL